MVEPWAYKNIDAVAVHGSKYFKSVTGGIVVLSGTCDVLLIVTGFLIELVETVRFRDEPATRRK
jgi:hypothetical protein